MGALFLALFKTATRLHSLHDFAAMTNGHW
jgi:hypothetical protein